MLSRYYFRLLSDGLFRPLRPLVANKEQRNIGSLRLTHALTSPENVMCARNDTFVLLFQYDGYIESACWLLLTFRHYAARGVYVFLLKAQLHDFSSNRAERTETI